MPLAPVTRRFDVRAAYPLRTLPARLLGTYGRELTESFNELLGKANGILKRFVGRASGAVADEGNAAILARPPLLHASSSACFAQVERSEMPHSFTESRCPEHCIDAFFAAIGEANTAGNQSLDGAARGQEPAAN